MRSLRILLKGLFHRRLQDGRRHNAPRMADRETPKAIALRPESEAGQVALAGDADLAPLGERPVGSVVDDELSKKGRTLLYMFYCICCIRARTAFPLRRSL